MFFFPLVPEPTSGCQRRGINIDLRPHSAPTTSFVYRACVILGAQQIDVIALWYWGAALAKTPGSVFGIANLDSYPKIIEPV